MLYPLWSCPTSAGEDDVVYYWPLRTMAARQVRAGQWPTWNSGEAAGVPLFADPQHGLFFPTTWLFFALPHRLAYSLCIFLAFAVAGGGAYLYLRRVGLSLPAAMFGGAAFMFCGFMVGHRVHLAIIQAAGLLGWGLWSIERVRTSGRAGFAWMAPIFFLALAAGHWPTAVHMTLIWLAYLLLRGRPIGRALAVAAAAALVAGLLMAPQIAATASYLRQTVRGETPYLVAGENSFFPLCTVLAFFPFIMGSRTPNFFSQPWWGPWHLCEMLGYVGLVTLVLAPSAVWRLYRKRGTTGTGADDAQQTKPTGRNPWALLRVLSRRFAPLTPTGRAPWALSRHGATPGMLTPLVRAWTWILIGAGVWALGYYLPSYRLIHMVPVLGTVRCPARMLLAIDFGLAALAAMAIHALITTPSPKLARTVRLGALIGLPLCMLGSVRVLMLAAQGEHRGWWRLSDVLSGGAANIREALDPLSPAVLVPAALAVATIAVLWWFVRSPGRRAWAVTVLMLVDLFFIARFVDVPAGDRPSPDPTRSPAAEWLRANAPTDEPFRVWGLSESYHHRPAELLLPKTCASLGFESLSYYGPLQPRNHALLFGFRPWGSNAQWDWLIRCNHLLSLYNVRYVVVAKEWPREILEDVRVRAPGSSPEGPDLLRLPQPGTAPSAGASAWRLKNARPTRDGFVLEPPNLLSAASAKRSVSRETGGIYRLSVELRAPDGAGGPVYVDWWWVHNIPARGVRSRWRWIRVDVEQLTNRWRRFDLAFYSPGPESRPAQPSSTRRGSPVPTAPKVEVKLTIKARGERPVEVRNVTLRQSDWPAPINFGGRLKPGERVYVDRTPEGLEALNPGDQRVHIYENRLCLPRSFPVTEAVRLADSHEVIEALRWRADTYDLTRQALTAVEIESLKELEFISDSPRSGSWPANGLGTLRTEGPLQGETPGAWWLAVPPAAVTLYLLLALAVMPKMNKKDANAVG